MNETYDLLVNLLKRSLLLGLLGVVLVGLSGEVRGAEGDLVYDTATGFYKKERWQDAVSEYRKFLANWPEDRRATSVRLYLGLSEVNLGDYQSARQNLRRYVELQPASKNLNHALYRIAECSYLLDELKPAQRELGEFLKRFPEDSYGERGIPYLADVEMRLGDFGRAAELFQESLKKYPSGELADDSRFGLARSLEGLQRYDEAAKVYEELAANPQGRRAAEALLNLGTRRFEDGNYAGASEAFVKLEEEYPKSELLGLARLNHGFALYRLEKYGEAIGQFEAVLPDPSQSMAAGFWKGMSLKNLGKLPESIEVFSKTIDQKPEDPLVESLLYQWGDCAKRLGDYKTAAKQFQEVVIRFPQGELADDALHLSAVCALEQQDVEQAKSLLGEFAKKFPNSKLLWSQELLKGRVLLLEKNPEGGRDQFRRVLVESNSEITKSWARYYIAYSFYQDKEYRQALQASEPLAANLEKLPAERRNDLAGVYVLQGACLLELGKANSDVEQRKTQLSEVEANAKRYLGLQPRGSQAARAWGLRALAAAHSGDAVKTAEILTALEGEAPAAGGGREELGRTLHEIAEVAFSNKKWDLSAELFKKLTELNPTPELRMKGAHGWGWSEYERKNFAAATVPFQMLLQEDPQGELTAETAFMLAKCRQEEGKTDEALATFEEVVKNHSQTKYGFPAALQKARLLSDAGKKDEANRAYTYAYEQFPQEADRDRLLDEWALMNYRQQDFVEADRIFGRLVQDFPQSSLADNARLSLAESTLVSLKMDSQDAEALRKLDEVRVEFRKLAEDAQTDPEVKQTALSQLMGIGVQKKDWKDVREIAERLLSESPEGKFREAAIYRQGEAALNLGDHPQAEQNMRKLLEIKDRPDVEQQSWYAQVPLVLGESLLAQGNRAEEIKEVVEGWRSSHPDSESQAGLDEIEGRSLVKQAKFPEAREAFTRAVENPKAARTETAARSQFLIAETFLAEKSYEQAEREYIKVETLYDFPVWQARAVYQSATCQEELKMTDAAIKSYELLLSKWPQSEQASQASQRLEILKKQAQTNPGK